MAFLDSPDSALAAITNGGRSLLARMAMEDVSFKLVGFDVGKSGYLGSNPVKIEPIDPSLTSLVTKFYPATGTTGFASIERPHPKTLVLNCRLGHSDPDNVGAIGELGVWVEIVESSVPSEIGTKVLFAVAHFPLIVKNLQNVFVLRVLIQL